MITKESFIGVTGADPKTTAEHWPSIIQAMERYRIDTTKRQAAFLSNCAHETGGLRRLTENLNYSARGLLSTWPSRFTQETALQYERKPELIANLVYGHRMGNEEDGDGWKFRGRGLFHITGRMAYRLASSIQRYDFIENPDAIAKPPYAAYTAGYYWHLNRLNDLADKGKIRAIRVAINGGLNGFDEVLKFYNKLAVL